MVGDFTKNKNKNKNKTNKQTKKQNFEDESVFIWKSN